MATFTPQVQPERKYALINGIQMYYEVHGTGRPLVLLHGGGSTMYTTFGTIMPALSKSYQVVAVELQAHGHTEDRNEPVSFEQDADDVAELLKQLGITQANIFGFSNGGQTALEIAIRHPQAVRSLIIASAFYKKDGVPQEFWDGFNQPDFSSLPQVYKDEFLKIRNDQSALMSMFNKDFERMRVFKGWNEKHLRSIQAPALVVVGDHDLPTPEHAVEMYRLFPNGHLAVLPGNHGSYMGEMMSNDTDSRIPELFVAIIEQFLALPVAERQ